MDKHPAIARYIPRRKGELLNVGWITKDGEQRSVCGRLDGWAVDAKGNQALVVTVGREKTYVWAKPLQRWLDQVDAAAAAARAAAQAAQKAADRPTEKQITYALDLIARADRKGLWRHTVLGAGFDADQIDREHLLGMGRAEVRNLIEELRSELDSGLEGWVG